MNSIELLSPLNSKKELPKNHNIETRYQSYEKAKDYIKHLTRVYDNTLFKSAEYDFSCVESINFRSKLPQLNAKFKPSNYPNSHLSKELFEKMNMINAYNNLSGIKNSKTRFRPKSTIFTSPKTQKANGKGKEMYHAKSKNPFCSKCNLRKFQCGCISPTKNLEVNRSLNSPRSLKLSSFDQVGLKNSKYFRSSLEKDQLSVSHGNARSLSPRKLNSTSLYNYS